MGWSCWFVQLYRMCLTCKSNCNLFEHTRKYVNLFCGLFLSGISEITSVVSAAQEYNAKSQGWIILPLHSTLSLEEQDKVRIISGSYYQAGLLSRPIIHPWWARRYKIMSLKTRFHYPNFLLKWHPELTDRS